MALMLNYTYYRVCEATTNNEIMVYWIVSTIAFIDLVIDVILFIKYFKS